MSAAQDAVANELAEKLNDQWWRITSGCLYKITIKGDKGEDGLVMPFIPNRAQRRLLKRFWHRNIILKARQLGFTTLISILWLDYALFNANVRCGIIAQDREAAEIIFRDKVKFAYENLPDALKQMMPLKRDSAIELLFGHNNSSIRVSTSMRSGTIHRLHISEFGKICAKYPDKAREVITGSIPAVPRNGVLFIESTAEGQSGDFYDITMRSIQMAESKKELTELDYRFHFFPWHEEPGYEMDEHSVIITSKDNEYFEDIEAKLKVKLSPRQRAWYVNTRDSTFSGNEEKMWSEYPSTAEEAFQNSNEHCYYTAQLSSARKNGRIGNIPLIPSIPCNTFWDIGNSDGTAIWVHQRVGQQNNFVQFYEAWGEPYSHAVKWIQDLNLIWDVHYLPHDANHVRQGMNVNESPLQMLEKLLPRARFRIVPRTSEINWGIQQTRDAFPTCFFDETACKEGIIHLQGYRKAWNERTARPSDLPLKDIHTEAADAFRQFAQGYKDPYYSDEDDEDDFSNRRNVRSAIGGY